MSEGQATLLLRKQLKGETAFVLLSSKKPRPTPSFEDNQIILIDHGVSCTVGPSSDPV